MSKKTSLFLCGMLALLLVTTTTAQVSGTTTSPTTPAWAGNLISGHTTFLNLIPASDPLMAEPGATDPATTDPPNLPPGTKFKLFGAAADVNDPQNAYNQVISFDTHDPNAVAGAVKLFGGHVKVAMLTDQIELKYLYVQRTCGGGSTRFQLAIDTNGDGQPDGNAFGYVGDKPFGGGCATGQWTYEDMTNAVPKWDLSQFPGSAAYCTAANPFLCTWQQVVAYFQTVWPNHQVMNEVLVDDSQSFFTPDQGCAYFDLVSAGARTLTRWDDTSNSGDLPDNCR